MSEFQKDLQLIRKYQIQWKLRKILRFLLIGSLIGRNSDKKISELTEKIRTRITGSLGEINKLIDRIAYGGTYLIYPDRESCISKIKTVEAEITFCAKNRVLDAEFLDETANKLGGYLEFVLNYNNQYTKQRKNDYKHLWTKGNMSLDDEQQTAVVTDDKYNLVVAAAGSGKTEVLITRKPDSVQPNRILAIAYQRKATEEIAQRLQERYGIRAVNVRTFHKLGKDILECSGKKLARTDIVDDNKKHEFMKYFFEQEIGSNPEFHRLFLSYVKTIHDKDEEATIADKEAGLAYAKGRSYFSIDNTQIRSRAEKEIMDFLLVNKLNARPILVNYEPDVSGFRPDFYLPQHALFIEHWALSKNGEVPEWFGQSTQQYKESMDIKKKWFAEHNSLLIETFAYEYNEKKPEEFINLLKERIQIALERKYEKKFEFTPKTYEEILEIAWESQRTPIEDIQNFITTAKTYGLLPDKIANRLRSGQWTRKQLAFGNLALTVFWAYQAQLRESGKIDFEDMINGAIEALDRDGSLYANLCDHILIDEYQDISAQRVRLIKKLLERNSGCKLFCVGDDWQSIMAFSGSNLDFFVNFDDYFQHPAISTICTNYRSTKTIVDAGSDLIRNNGDRQIQKSALSSHKGTEPILVLESLHKANYQKQYHEQTAKDCLDRINGYLERGYAPNDIIVLTRYMRTKIKGKTRFFQIVQTLANLAKQNGTKIAIDNAKMSSAIRLLTVHKCKGLEAKVVFILDVVSGDFGFPSEIEDPSILAPARDNSSLPNQKEEERRLFYVAITRAKEDLYVYTQEKAKSEFLSEIKNYTKSKRLGY
jgi:DNA helicase-4